MVVCGCGVSVTGSQNSGIGGGNDQVDASTPSLPQQDAGSPVVSDAPRQALSSFPITVVTTRPASGEYVMILFGGTQSGVGTGFGHAQNTLDCGDTVKNDVGWVSDTVPSLQEVANDAVGAIGFGIGLTATTDTSDCMCGWGNNCQATGAACTLSTGGRTLARDEPGRAQV